MMMIQKVFIILDPKGDISIGSCWTGLLWSGQFHDFHLDRKANLELVFLMSNQVKGLILSLQDIQKLERILFQYPKYPECIIFDLFVLNSQENGCRLYFVIHFWRGWSWWEFLHYMMIWTYFNLGEYGRTYEHARFLYHECRRIIILSLNLIYKSCESW